MWWHGQKTMTEVKPNECCTAAWKSLDVWDNADLPEKLVCQDCGNVATFTPSQHHLPESLKGCELESVSIHWHAPEEGKPQ